MGDQHRDTAIDFLKSVAALQPDFIWVASHAIWWVLEMPTSRASQAAEVRNAAEYEIG
jgi:hypothetical protein